MTSRFGGSWAYFARKLQEVGYPQDQYQALYDKYFSGVRTMREMNEVRDGMMGEVRGLEG